MVQVWKKLFQRYDHEVESISWSKIWLLAIYLSSSLMNLSMFNATNTNCTCFQHLFTEIQSFVLESPIIRKTEGTQVFFSLKWTPEYSRPNITHWKMLGCDDPTPTVVDKTAYIKYHFSFIRKELNKKHMRNKIQKPKLKNYVWSSLF